MKGDLGYMIACQGERKRKEIFRVGSEPRDECFQSIFRIDLSTEKVDLVVLKSLGNEGREVPKVVALFCEARIQKSPLSSGLPPTMYNVEKRIIAHPDPQKLFWAVFDVE